MRGLALACWLMMTLAFVTACEQRPATSGDTDETTPVDQSQTANASGAAQPDETPTETAAAPESAAATPSAPTAPEIDPATAVYTTFYPTEYLTRRIVGDLLPVVNPCPPGADPAAWQPSDEILAQYQAALAIVINGADFESWVGRATLPEDRVINTSEKLADRLIELPGTITHSHGDGEHTHAGIDGHLWLDPVNLMAQSTAIQMGLAKMMPEHEMAFALNLLPLVVELTALHEDLQLLAPKLRDVQFVANHPTYNYLAAQYGLKIETFYLKPDGETDAEELERLAAFLAETSAKFLLWETEPAATVAKKFEEQYGLTSIVYAAGESLSPKQRAAGEDFLSIQRANVERLAQAAGS